MRNKHTVIPICLAIKLNLFPRTATSIKSLGNKMIAETFEPFFCVTVVCVVVAKRCFK